MTVEQPQADQATERVRKLGARERAMIVVLIIVAVIALLFMVLMGGGDDGTETPRAVPRPTFTPSASPEPTEDDLPPETSDDLGGRDPFQPLVSAEDVSEPGVTPTSTPTGTIGGRDTDGDGAPEEPRRVGLLDVFSEDGERMATVDVDGDQYTVREGETFADSFRLLDLTRDCGTFVFGDERFTLCIGQEVNK